jgi:hypothetical protein
MTGEIKWIMKGYIREILNSIHIFNKIEIF